MIVDGGLTEWPRRRLAFGIDRVSARISARSMLQCVVAHAVRSFKPRKPAPPTTETAAPQCTEPLSPAERDLALAVDKN
jgi:hypothetical protein